MSEIVQGCFLQICSCLLTKIFTSRRMLVHFIGLPVR